MVGTLSASARPLVVGGQAYYYDSNNYYQPCYQGSDAGYCVVQNPNEYPEKQDLIQAARPSGGQ